MEINYDLTLFVTGILSCLLAFVLKALRDKRNYEMETMISEKDLLKRIDSLQQQVIQLVKENSALRLEVANLSAELKRIGARFSD